MVEKVPPLLCSQPCVAMDQELRYLIAAVLASNLLLAASNRCGGIIAKPLANTEGRLNVTMTRPMLWRRTDDIFRDRHNRTARPEFELTKD